MEETQKARFEEMAWSSHGFLEHTILPTSTPENLAVPGCPLLLLKDPAGGERGTRPFSREPAGDTGRLPGPHDGRVCSPKARGRKGPLGLMRGLQRAWGRHSPDGPACHHVGSNSPTHPERETGRRRGGGLSVEEEPAHLLPRSPKPREATALRPPGAGHSEPSPDLASRPPSLPSPQLPSACVL